MKIKVCNLGAVKEAEIDLKPLTVFVGPNNTGKTWTAYAISSILGPYGWERYIRSLDSDNLPQIYETLSLTVQQAINEGSAKFDIYSFAEQFGEEYINQLAKEAKQWMRKYIGAKRSIFENFEAHISLGDAKAQLLLNIKERFLDSKFPGGSRKNQKPLVRLYKEKNDNTIYFYTQNNVLEKMPLKLAKDFLISATLEILQDALYPKVYTLPTERATFITMLADFTGSTGRSRKPLTEAELAEHEEKAGPDAIGNFLGTILVELPSNSIADREEAIKETPQIKTYMELARLLEAEVLKGAVDFSDSSQATSKELLFQPLDTQEVTLEMPVVSSMVKELSPLVLYLRYLIGPRDWLIIDEPEMNLHPKAQVRLMEFLAMLVNSGLQVLITTHSPYMVDHLVNLIKAGQSDNQDQLVERFFLKNKRAFISQDRVSVQLFENGTAKQILDEEGFVDWGTFGQVSDQLRSIFFAI